MSADAWRYCPKCQPVVENIESEQIYEHPNLREDYEQFMAQNGRYFLYYKCSCKQCGFSWSFSHQRQVTDLTSTHEDKMSGGKGGVE
jgi:hypothetical protein